MNSTLFALLLRFYCRCFVYPYDELVYELQHHFRLLENEVMEPEELIYIEQALNILNAYQGLEIKEVRDDYVNLFGDWENKPALCPMIASDFSARFVNRYDSRPLDDLFLESGLPVNPDEPLDSIVNYLEYLSYMIDGGGSYEEVQSFVHDHVQPWIPRFCDVLRRSAGISFYREVGTGLSDLILIRG